MLDVTPRAGSLRAEPLLSAVSVSKRYGDFLANDGIDIDLFPAEIHALLGENGAGKSTLVKVMYGLIQPSGGELRWMGKKVVLSGPSEARALGIGMVFQHFTLFENLTVAENVALGLPPTESFAAISARLEKTARAYGLPLDPKREVWRLSVGERQRIEIVRALLQIPKLLILDEPTSVLTPQEADLLFVVLGAAQERGTRRPLHQSQARRSETAVRYGDNSARRQEGVDLQSAPGNRCIAGAHDGRRRNRRGEGRLRPFRGAAAAGGRQAFARAGRSARDLPRRRFAGGVRRRGRWHRRRLRQRPG